MELIRKVRPAFVAFAVLTLVNIGGFVQQRRNTDGVAAVQRQQAGESRRARIAECEGLNTTNRGITEFITTLVNPNPERREDETDAQFQRRVEGAHRVLDETTKKFPQKVCRG